MLVNFFFLGNQQQTGSSHIQTVNNQWTGGFGVLLSCPVVNRKVGFFPGNRQHARRLVDDQQVIVFIKNLQ